MKKLMCLEYAIVLATALSAACALLQGCAGTYVSKDGSKTVGCRLAFAYPFALSNLSSETQTTNGYERFSLGAYTTDGGQKNIEAVSAAAVKALDAYLLSQTGCGLLGAASKASAITVTPADCADGSCALPVK